MQRYLRWGLLVASLTLFVGVSGSCSNDASTPSQPASGDGGSAGEASGGAEQGGDAGNPNLGGSAPNGGSSGQAGSGGQGGHAGSGASGGAGTSGSAGETAGGSGGGGSGGSPPIPSCVLSCNSPADCAMPNSFPASDYACESNVCRYIGCSSDQTCKDVFHSDGYVCRPPIGGSINTCVQRCQLEGECAVANDQGAFSADNYHCETDHCVYDGCHSDDECTTSMQGADYRCRPISGLGSYCQKGCTVADDCATPSMPVYSADRYRCEDQVCVYLGCQSDEACQQTVSNAQYVCR